MSSVSYARLSCEADVAAPERLLLDDCLRHHREVAPHCVADAMAPSAMAWRFARAGDPGTAP